jgi:YVTN family beta-propeller protein
MPSKQISFVGRSVLACVSLIAAASGAAVESATQLQLDLVADIPLPGDTSRFDYASFDPGRHVLYVAHLGASEVLALDTEKQQIVARIPSLSQVHGVLAIPELGKVYASATGSNEVAAIDEATHRTEARIPGGVYPDGMAYVPEAHKLYVSDEHGDSDTVIDVRSNTRLTTIPLGGEVGNTQYDPGSRHIFANVQTRGQLAEIDPATDRVVARIDLPGARGNHGLLIDSASRRAYIACEGNSKLLVLDLETKHVVESFDVGDDPDVLALDPGLHLLYVTGEAGVVSMFSTAGGKTVKLSEAVLAPNAHVVAVDAATHRVYFPLKNLGGKPVLRVMTPKA